MYKHYKLYNYIMIFPGRFFRSEETGKIFSPSRENCFPTAESSLSLLFSFYAARDSPGVQAGLIADQRSSRLAAATLSRNVSTTDTTVVVVTATTAAVVAAGAAGAEAEAEAEVAATAGSYGGDARVVPFVIVI